ncbi:MAG: hypothetical protein M1457_03875 [bacterium]|nr:hypothetical protein [bacterium]
MLSIPRCDVMTCLVVLTTIWLPSAGAQSLGSISGYVKTPTGTPVNEAFVWIAPGIDGTWYTTASDGRYSVDFVYGPYTHDKYLRISKAGWDFEPSNYYFAKTTGGNLTRNFTGVVATTSGKTLQGSLSPNEWSYYAMQVPVGATEMNLEYDGTGDAGLVATPNTWPTEPPALAPGPNRAAVTNTLTINTASTPPISAGKWYIGVYSRAATDFTLTTTLGNGAPLPTISGKVLQPDGSPFEGAAIMTDSDATTATTTVEGTYSVTAPYYWTGQVRVEAEGHCFTPAVRTYSQVAADVTDQDFQEFEMNENVVVQYLIGLKTFNADELAAADANEDKVIDIADVITFVLMEN